jgi:hypothetical protein
MKNHNRSARKASLLGFVCFVFVAVYGFFYRQTVERLQKIATALGDREESDRLHGVRSVS